MTFIYIVENTRPSGVQMWGEIQTSVTHGCGWRRVFMTIKRNTPGVTYHRESSWFLWLLWQMLPHLCVYIEKRTVWMWGGFHLGRAFSRGTVSTGEPCGRTVIKRPSGCKRWCKDIVTPLRTTLQQLRQQSRLTVSDRTELFAQGSAPDDKTGWTHLCSHVWPHPFAACSNAVALLSYFLITYSFVYSSCGS